MKIENESNKMEDLPFAKIIFTGAPVSSSFHLCDMIAASFVNDNKTSYMSDICSI